MKNILIISICIFTVTALSIFKLKNENKNLKENATTKIYYMGTTTKDVSVKELVTLKCEDNGGEFKVYPFGGAYCVKDSDEYEWNFELDNFTKNGLVELK